MTPSEREFYVLLWRKVYRWLLARGPRRDLNWTVGDADQHDETTWTPPECCTVKDSKPVVLWSGSYDPRKPTRGQGYVYIEWFLALGIAETEGVLQPDEAVFLRDGFYVFMHTAVIENLLALSPIRCGVPTGYGSGVQPCVQPLGHTGMHKG
jgi:hypothetical protein